MQHKIVYDDVSISTITKEKEIKERVYITEDIQEYVAMCKTIDHALTGKDGLIKRSGPIVENGVQVGMFYKYERRSKN